MADEHEKDGKNPEDEAMDRREAIVHGTAVTMGTALTLSNLNHLMNTTAHAAEDHHLSSELRALIEKHWHDQDAVYEKIAEAGMQKYYNDLPNKEKVFFTPEEIEAGHGKCSCCSDEGNRKYVNGGDHPMLLIRTPGSGILQALDLVDKNPFDPKFIEQTAQELLDTGVTVQTAHAGCGAAKAVLKAWLVEKGKMQEAEHLTQSDVDAFAKEWAMTVARKMKELSPDRTSDIRSDFIAQLDRPKEIHRARILYLTDDDAFNANYEGLPQGFVERTGGKDDLKDVLDHVDILRSIAFDEGHGFGTKFGEKAPEQFVICCVARNEQRLKKLKDDAGAKVRSLAPDVAKRVRIDGFLA